MSEINYFKLCILWMMICQLYIIKATTIYYKTYDVIEKICLIVDVSYVDWMMRWIDCMLKNYIKYL
jgi:hypothetical protein